MKVYEPQKQHRTGLNGLDARFSAHHHRHDDKTRFQTIRLTLDGVDGLCEPLDVVGGDTSNGDTAVLGGVNGVLLGQSRHLLGGEPSVGEHADLAGDVGPVVLGAELLEVVLEERAHLDDAVGHALDLTKPLLVQLGVVEDLGGDARTVHGGVGVERAHDDLDLRVDALLLGGIFADDGEGTGTLTVKTLRLC